MKTKLIIFDLDETLFSRLSDDYTDEDVKSIKLLTGAEEFLKNNEYNVLVSMGNFEFQWKKIDVLGIKSYFKEIIITPTKEGKKECFKKIMEKELDKEIFVVGDRRDSEIRYGNELGLKTILLKRGKYKNLEAKDNFEVPTYVVESYEELKKIL